MSYFRTSRNIELSTIFYIDSNVTSDWSGITVVKGFTNAYSASLPVIAVYETDMNLIRQEIGTTTHRKQAGITIDIFATSDGQRIDLADYICDKLVTGWIYYEHSHASGDNTAMVRTANGRVTFLRFIENRKIEFSENVEVQDRFRHTISFVCEKN